jgi:adenylate cyclase
MAEKRVQRRLAAILAADVVGYSRLVRADEEGILARLNSLRNKIIDPSIARHDGRIVKLMGDGMLVEFASVVDAVRNAIEVQRAVAEHEADVPDDRRIVFRVGINLGDVVIDGNDIQGDGVNVAARLEELADPGSVCISGAVYDQVRDRIDLPYQDLGEQEIKNIDRPIRAWRWAPETSTAVNEAGTTTKPMPLPDKPSIAVLPFDNMGGDPDQEFFADGITEDVITELSRYPDLFVISRNSAFTYKGRAVKVQEIRRDLGVHYVVEGSTRKSGNRVRVTVQLIDSASGNHVWAERYDRELVDIFDLQDELTQAIVATLPGRLGSAEEDRFRRKPPQDMAAFDYLLAGKIHHHRVTKEDNAEALRLLDKAIELDPRFAQAYAWKACTLGQAIEFGFGERPDELDDQAFEAVNIALSLDENDVECHRLLCEINMERHQLDQAVIHGARALAQNPNDPRLVAQKGELLTWLGKPDEGAVWIKKAIRLDPHGAPARAHLLGRALYGARRYADAVDAYRQITSPRYGHLANMAACYAQMGRDAEAQEQAAAALRLKPEFEIETYLQSLPFKETTDRNHLADGLRMAGLPE